MTLAAPLSVQAGDADGTLTNGTYQSRSKTSAHLLHLPVQGGVATVGLDGQVTGTAANPIAYEQTMYGYTWQTNGATQAHSEASVTAATARPFTFDLRAAATGQALSALPAYFSGTGCQTQGTATAMGGSVSHAQLLVDGTVVAEYFDGSVMGPHPTYATTGTSQASVPLSATFDATGFADGYNVVVMMKVWDTQGNTYDARLSAPAYLPTLSAYVVWTPDDTLPAPIPQAATQSGKSRLDRRGQPALR